MITRETAEFLTWLIVMVSAFSFIGITAYELQSDLDTGLRMKFAWSGFIGMFLNFYASN